MAIREYFFMKMNSQSRSFVKQVQVDLLVLSDADLLHTIQQWVEGSSASDAVPEDTLLALGYTYADANPLVLHQSDMPGAESEESAQWHAPSSHHLRTTLNAMDANLFAQHVIALAFAALHPIYPEWYEGVTFNAHLANYLRRTKDKTIYQGQGATQKISKSL
jgi:hypothetical protein